MTYEQAPLIDILTGFFTPANATVLVALMAIAIGLLAIFLIHSITIWLSTDPEIAFHNARMIASGFSTVWNSFRSLSIIAMKISLRWVPGWNTMAKHMIEPAIHIIIDVMSQVFAHKHFEGVIKDSYGPGGMPFRGHYCGKPAYNENGDYTGTASIDDATSKFCTFSKTLWAQELGATESSDGNNAITNNSLILSTAHARKLQELVGEASGGEGESMFPAIPLGPMLAAVQELTGIVAMIQTTAYDIGAHIAYTVLSELASVLFNIAQILVRAVSSVVMSLVASGALTSIIKSGIDFLISLVVHVALPVMFAGLDLVMCLVNMIQPDTWADQLSCVERTCFKEDGDIGTLLCLDSNSTHAHSHTLTTDYNSTVSSICTGSEIFTTFSSIPIVAKQVSKSIEALVNPTTGRNFGESAQGQTDSPDIGNDAHATPAAATCAACFSCKVRYHAQTFQTIKP